MWKADVGYSRALAFAMASRKDLEFSLSLSSPFPLLETNDSEKELMTPKA
jgi:hypothetical protein